MKQSLFNPQEEAILQHLTKAQELLNAADATRSTINSDLSSQSNAYGDVYDAIKKVIASRYPHLDVQDVNYSGNETWFHDWMDAVQKALNKAVKYIDKRGIPLGIMSEDWLYLPGDYRTPDPTSVKEINFADAELSVFNLFGIRGFNINNLNDNQRDTLRAEIVKLIEKETNNN